MTNTILTLSFYAGELSLPDLEQVVNEVITKTVKPQLHDDESVELQCVEIGRLHKSSSATATLLVTIEGVTDEECNEFKRWLSSEISDKVSSCSSANDGTPAEVLPDASESSSDLFGGILGNLMGKHIPEGILNDVLDYSDVIDGFKADKDYYEKHVHYNILSDAIKSFDREFITQLSELTKLDGHQFSTGCRNCVTTLMSYFTINGNTNWPDLYVFINDIKKSLKYELDSCCDFRDDSIGRTVDKHLAIVQENLYNKILFALTNIEFEVNLCRGVLPPVESN